MKLFYKHFTQRVIMFFLLIGITVSSAAILNSWAIHEEYTPTQEAPPIPSWIKNNAGWWADGQIDDNSFVSGLQWLISNGIMKVG